MRTRILLVHYRDDPASGGAIRVGEALARHLDRERFEAHCLFAYGGPGPVARTAGVPCHWLGARGGRDPAAWFRARRLVRRLAPDVIHYVDTVVWLVAALAGLGRVRVRHVHGRYLVGYGRRFDGVVHRVLDRLVDAHVAITHGSRRTLVELGWASEDRAFTVHNGVDVARFADLPPRDEARARLGIPADALLAGMVCRLVFHRGCQDGLAILGRLPPPWRLVLVGDGPYRGELERQARDSGLEDRVHFTGYLEDTRRAYAALDAFLFLARYDSFGLATAEAMAAGVPVFGLGADGEYREPEDPLVTPSNATFVERARPLDYDSPEPPEVLGELAGRLEDFRVRPDPYRAKADDARAWVRARFGAERQAEAVARIYESLLDRG